MDTLSQFVEFTYSVDEPTNWYRSSLGISQAHIVKVKNDLYLVIVGEGPIKEHLVRELHRRRLQEFVHFSGFVDEESKVALYKLGDLFVLPSHYEPFGIVVLEAMSSRIPVVVSDVGGLSEIVEDNVTGLKVLPSDYNSLAITMRKVLESPQLADIWRIVL